MNPTIWLALLRGVGHGGLALAAGGSLFLLMARQTGDPRIIAWTRRWHKSLPWVAAVYLVCATAALFFQAAFAADAPPALMIHKLDLLRAYVLETRHGRIALANLDVAVLMLIPALFLMFNRRSGRGDGFALAALSAIATATAAIGPLSGHAAADETINWLVPFHIGHVVAMSLWLGGLPPWIAFALWSARHTKYASPATARIVRNFSLLATICMALIVVSGVLLASTFAGSIGDLLGTDYGRLICAKVALLAGVLLIANTVRQQFLPRLLQDGDPGYGRPARSVAVELLLALFILALASILGQTAPAVHDQPIWPLPFRLSLAATWPEWPAPLVTICASAAAFAALGLFVVRRQHLASSTRALCLLVAITGIAVAGWQVSVPAFPDTYRRSTIPYLTMSIVAGMRNFNTLCTACHGVGALGDGPARGSLPGRPPANLSEPHTALHTAGDMYWWMGHGIPESGMPPFADQLDEQARWDTINFLRAFSEGFQARILQPSVIPGRPWLGAPNFYFASKDGAQRELKDYRNKANVLLVFPSRDPAEATRRAQQLGNASEALRAAHCEILFVVSGAAIDSAGFAVIDDPAEEIRAAYDLLSRTIVDRGDGRQLGMRRDGMEFLIDRFGFLRARWIPAEDPGRWTQPETLAPDLRILNAEPQILASPDDHVH
jgi:putative copper resistance protein D